MMCKNDNKGIDCCIKMVDPIVDAVEKIYIGLRENIKKHIGVM